MTHKRIVEIVKGFKGKRVLVIGDLMLDHTIRGAATRVCPEAPALVVNVEAEVYAPGGAANAVANFCSLGATVEAAGLVGGDDNGDRLLEMLREIGVDTGFVFTDPCRETTTKTRVFAGQTLIVRVDSERSVEPNKYLRDRLSESVRTRREIDAIFVSDYRKGVVGKDVMTEVRGRNLLTVADPKGLDFSLYQGVTAITPNSAEVLQATGAAAGGWDAEERACRDLIAKHGFKAVLLTRSELGVAVFEVDTTHSLYAGMMPIAYSGITLQTEPTVGRPTLYPSFATAPVNVSGAGDTVAAAYTLALLAGASHPEAAYVGNLAAGIVVSREKRRTVMPDEIVNNFHAEG